MAGVRRATSFPHATPPPPAGRLGRIEVPLSLLTDEVMLGPGSSGAMSAGGESRLRALETGTAFDPLRTPTVHRSTSESEFPRAQPLEASGSATDMPDPGAAAIAHQTAGEGEFTIWEDRRQRMADREHGDQVCGISAGNEICIANPHKRPGVANKRPPCSSIIERQIDSPIPIPSDFVV
jgi:hypothetical protein